MPTRLKEQAAKWRLDTRRTTQAAFPGSQQADPSLVLRRFSCSGGGTTVPTSSVLQIICILPIYDDQEDQGHSHGAENKSNNKRR
tara:strand:+ start:657 stop:911 length:255 start_codon:yes stop_codon:yes gene_type:complete